MEFEFAFGKFYCTVCTLQVFLANFLKFMLLDAPRFNVYSSHVMGSLLFQRIYLIWRNAR